jgi:hypothetical protein
MKCFIRDASALLKPGVGFSLVFGEADPVHFWVRVTTDGVLKLLLGNLHFESDSFDNSHIMLAVEKNIHQLAVN